MNIRIKPYGEERYFQANYYQRQGEKPDPTMEILTFDDINASHAATGYHGRTNLPGFHIFSVEDTYPSTRQFMPPYTLNFYQVVLLEPADAVLSMNADASTIRAIPSPLPHRSMCWPGCAARRRRGSLFTSNQKILMTSAAHPRRFSFFRPTELNLLRVSSEEKDGLRVHFAQLAEMYAVSTPTVPDAPGAAADPVVRVQAPLRFAGAARNANLPSDRSGRPLPHLCWNSTSSPARR